MTNVRALVVLLGIGALATTVSCSRKGPGGGGTGMREGTVKLAEEISLASPWKSAFLEADLRSGRVAYGGHNPFGSYTVWDYRRTLVLSGGTGERRVNLAFVYQGSERDFDRTELDARWTLAPSPDGACLAVLREGAPRAGYVALGPEPIHCPCMVLELDGGKFPFEKARTARALVDFHLDPDRNAETHRDGVERSVMERIRDFVSARPVDSELGLLFARAALRGDCRLGALENVEGIPAYQSAVAAQEAVAQEYRRFLEDRGVAWTWAADNAVVALERCADETTQFLVLAHLGIPIPRGNTRIEGNFHRHAVRALSRITCARKAAPIAAAQALTGLFPGGEAYDRLFAIPALVALDTPAGWKALEQAAEAEGTEAPAWPADFDAFLLAIEGAPCDEAAVRRWAASAWAHHRGRR